MGQGLFRFASLMTFQCIQLPDCNVQVVKLVSVNVSSIIKINLITYVKGLMKLYATLGLFVSIVLLCLFTVKFYT